MAKDPAILFYKDAWLVATKGMRADCRGWYINLLLYQFDKGDLPNDIEELASLADVRASEYDLFKQVFEQVLKQKFKVLENGRLSNDFAMEVLKKREMFKEKRSLSGKIGYFIRFARNNDIPEEVITYVKENVDFTQIDTKNEQVLIDLLEQVLKQKFKLYINRISLFSSSPSTQEKKIENNVEEKNDSHFSEIGTPFLTVEMAKKFYEQNPTDLPDSDEDKKSCLAIAQKIEKAKGWDKFSSLGEKMEATLAEWEKILKFISQNNFFKKFVLKNIANQFQAIWKAYVSEPEKKSQNSAEVDTAIRGVEFLENFSKVRLSDGTVQELGKEQQILAKTDHLTPKMIFKGQSRY